MTHLTKDVNGTTHYIYALALIRSNTILSVVDHKEDDKDKTVSRFSGASNEVQFLKVPADAYDNKDFLKCVSTVTGQDADNNDIVEYTVEADEAKRTEILMGALRAERDKRITSSDWTQMDDVPMLAQTKQEWANYRQLLRDFPLSQGLDMVNPTWPSKPE